MNQRTTSTDKWYEKPLRIAALQCESAGDPTRVLEAWSGMGFNVEQLLHISADGYHGYFREDRLREIRQYLAGARARGLRIIFYLGVMGPKDIRDNEAWAFRDRSGKSLGMPCVNGPFHDWYVAQVGKVAALDIEGIFLDGPLFPTGSCYCKHCEDLYRREYGTALPSVADFKSQAWRDFVQFRYDSIVRLVRDARNALKAVKPDAVLYTNGQPLGPGAANGRNNRRLADCEDLLGAEGGFIFYDPPDRTPWWKPGVTARLLEAQAEGKPTVVFIAGDHKPWNRYLHTAAETRLLIAATVANGANPWYGIHSPIEDLRAAGGQAAGEMMLFLRDHERYYTRTESLAQVALLWSQRTADGLGAEMETTDFNPRNSASGGGVNYTGCFGGFAEMLLRLHVPFDVIDEQSLLEGKLAKYPTIVLPDFACMNERETEALQEYVRAGGNLVASFETSRYPADFSRRSDFGLAEVLGVSLGEARYSFGATSYLGIVENTGRLAGFQPRLLPSPAWGIEVRPTTATPWAYFHAPVQEQYQPLPPQTTPAILSNRYGQGKAVYLAGSFSEHFRIYGIPDYPRILGRILDDFAAPLVSTQNLPETVELTLRVQRDAGRLLIHLVNFTGAMRRPISNVVKVHDAVLEIPKRTLQAAGLPSVGPIRALRSGATPKLVETATSVGLTVPPLEEYEVLVLSGDTGRPGRPMEVGTPTIDQ